MPKINCEYNRGFSLIELSIVLIVIGLLIAGIITGKKLIESAEINRLIVETRNFKQAVITFHMTYQAYPGDFADAHNSFGDKCDAVPENCNGDGNGIIEVTKGEHFRANQHLALARLWVGNYNGTSDHIVSAYHGNYYFPPSECSPAATDIGSNCHLLGGPGDPQMPGIRAVIAYRIDKKFDDSLPKTGRIRFKANSNVTETSCGNTEYLINQGTLGCNLFYPLDIIEY